MVVPTTVLSGAFWLTLKRYRGAENQGASFTSPTATSTVVNSTSEAGRL